MSEDEQGSGASHEDGRKEQGRGAGQEPKSHAAVAHALGWALIGLEASALLVLRVDARISVRLTAAAWSFGQAIALGLISAALIAVGERLLPRRAAVRYAAALAVAFGVGLVILQEDFAGVAGSLGGERWGWAVRTALIAGTAAAIPAAALGGRALARGPLRLVGVVVGVVVGGAHALVLAGLYPGLHAYAAWIGAVLIGASLRGAGRLDGLVQRMTPIRRALVCAPALVLALGSVLVRPPAQALVKLVSFPGAVAAPYAALVHPRSRARHDANLDPEWFRDRSDHAPVPPTTRPTPLLPPDGIVVLLTGECQRADLVERPDLERRLPNLWRLAQGGVRFSNARSPSPATGPTIAAIFSGRYYSQLYWKERGSGERVTVFPNEDRTPRFPATLSAAGVDTLNFSGQRTMNNVFGLVSGFSEESPLGSGGRASALVDAVLERLETRPTKPLFIYGHFKEGHGPYRGAGKTEWDKYISDLGQVDKQIGRLLDRIEQPDLAARTVLIVTADHGEAFGEHGLNYHGTSVYDELLRVNLLARVPGIPARREERTVSTMDLGPTILDLFGIPTPGHHMGQSLVPYLLGRPEVLTRPIVADSGRRIQAMVFADGMKVIFDRRLGTAELYDLSRDPGELDTLTDQKPELLDQKLNVLDAFFEAHELRKPGYKTPYRP